MAWEFEKLVQRFSVMKPFLDGTVPATMKTPPRQRCLPLDISNQHSRGCPRTRRCHEQTNVLSLRAEHNRREARSEGPKTLPAPSRHGSPRPWLPAPPCHRMNSELFHHEAPARRTALQCFNWSSLGCCPILVISARGGVRRRALRRLGCWLGLAGSSR